MMQHDHSWYLDLIPAYAIGAADPDERSAVDAHLASCLECRDLVADYRRLGDELAFAAPLAPAPAGLSEDLRKRVSDRRGLASQSTWLTFLLRPVFAVAALAVALLVLTNLYWAGRVGRLENQAKQVAALAQAPGIALKAAGADRYAAGSANGVVYLQPGSNVALLCVYALPQPGTGKTYQAWLLRDGQRISAGTFGVSRDGYGVLLIDAGKPVSDYQQLGITVEPAGGSPQPTTQRIMGGAL